MCQGAFDLVITDLMMPGMGGDRIAEVILSIGPVPPAILMTGTRDNLPLNRAKIIGIQKVVGKPRTKAELSMEIKGALSRHCEQ